MNLDNILDGLNGYMYTGIYQISKVRYLSEVIKTTGLNSVKNRIVSYEILRRNFDGCVTLYKDFVKKSSADNSQLLGIAVSSSKHSSGNKSVGFASEDRYYDSNEWYALSKK